MFGFFRRKPPPLPPFPYPIETVHGRDAFATFERLKTRGDISPVIIGRDDALETVRAHMSAQAAHTKLSVENILQSAAKITFPAGLQAHLAEEERKLKEKHPDWPPFEEGFEIGEWPDAPAGNHEPAAAREVLTRAYAERVHIALIPTTDPTQIPAYLYWGDWNACPGPQHHVAAARAWKERYGAELVSMTNDIAEYRVKRRPQSREEALALAREHHLYCSEIQNLSDHAADLMAGDWWLFWWD